MTAKITAHIARDDLSKRLIRWVQFLNSSLIPLTDRELSLLIEAFKLPDKFKSVPFSTIPKKLYSEKLGLEGLALQRLILSLFKKGYLIKDEYEEYDILPLLKMLIEKGNLEKVKIRFELDWILDSISPVSDSIPNTLKARDILIQKEDKAVPIQFLKQKEQDLKQPSLQFDTDVPNPISLTHPVKDSNALRTMDEVDDQKQRIAEFRARRKQ